TIFPDDNPVGETSTYATFSDTFYNKKGYHKRTRDLLIKRRARRVSLSCNILIELLNKK
ncbi:21505_t:CDS:2, partial [Cetraspora pellucida]